MKIVKSENLLADLKDQVLFLDANVFIGAYRRPEVVWEFLTELEGVNCDFATIPAVVFEFTRGSESLTDYNKRIAFIKKLTDFIYPIDRHIGNLQNFVMVCQKITKKIDYPDLLLLASLYKLKTPYLLSENHKHIPLDIFDRTHLVTFDTKKQIRTQGIYKISMSKYEKAAEKILT